MRQWDSKVPLFDGEGLACNLGNGSSRHYYQMTSIELSDSVIEALARLVDDGQADVKREPTHSTLTFHFGQAKLLNADPAHAGQTVGKAKRVRSVLSWALEHEPAAGGRLASTLIAVVRGSGGFRADSQNYVGDPAITDTIEALMAEGYVLERDGSVRPLLLDSLSGLELTKALGTYVRRAKRGSLDAALVTGTGKDLLEATAKHVLVTKFGTEPTTLNFPTVLAQAFMAVGFCIDKTKASSEQDRCDAALFELGCAANALRNVQGTGHGRAFPPTVSTDEARTAIESMGVIAQRLLSAL